MARSRYTVGLVFLTFFVISLLTNIIGPIVPDIISSFHVSLTAAGFLAFAFFIAYGVMSIPAGFLVERFTEKPVMVLAFFGRDFGIAELRFIPRIPRSHRFLLHYRCRDGCSAGGYQPALAGRWRGRTLRV